MRSKEINLVSVLFSQKQFKNAYTLGKSIKEKIKKLRNSGLDGAGIFSVENLAFKTLRNEGDLQKLSSLVVSSYDAMRSQDDFGQISIKIN